MTDRKQARAMDLPDYPCPPTVGEIATHAGSWGWFNAGHIAQDSQGYLWVKRDARPYPAPKVPREFQGLAAWTEGGIALYLHPRGYGQMKFLEGEVDEVAWAPVASVLREPPPFALPASA